MVQRLERLETFISSDGHCQPQLLWQLGQSYHVTIVRIG